ncbi:hypothetical protein [Longimicrobium sp.]|uniref:hypothetical protein n=1 Tax=Longimicrobium sp. TaxID=2029185 RepID=UPI002E312EBB|nr:hypothetical protein [Longimicrobium sp.]HEX6038948.1 hypothetical protein [Longimicrobium sp.]
MKNLCMRLSLIIAAAAVLCARPATAQQQAPGYKDPGIATIISVVVPGGGQMYAGETKRGAMLLGIGMGGVILGSAMSVESTSAAPMLAGSLLYLGTWVYGIMDASDSANRMNARRGMAVGGVRVEPTVAVQREGGTGVGVTLRF